MATTIEEFNDLLLKLTPKIEISLEGPRLIPDTKAVFVWWWWKAVTFGGQTKMACASFVMSMTQVAAVRRLGDTERAFAAFRDCFRLVSGEYLGTPEAELTAVGWVEDGGTIPMPELPKLKEGDWGGPDQPKQ